jgi:DNA repair protein RadC
MSYATALVNLPLVCEAKGGNVDTPDAVIAVCGDMAGLAQESMQVLTLDIKSKLISRHLVSLGTVESTIVRARETFRSAITDGASAVVIVHNHPSGDTTPSRDDIEATRRLIDAGNIIGITVFDHVIIGRNKDGGPAFLSLRERGLVSFMPAILANQKERSKSCQK